MRNAINLSYPVVESITSILPLCDEFIVVAGDSADATTELIRAIGDRKIRIIETCWDPELYRHGAIYAEQTNLALDACTGDWAFYIQADEVIHQRDLPLIERRMRQHLSDPRVEGLLFEYLHFYGDYQHVQTSHNWYGYEVRVVRTGIGVRSWHDAQGFRRNDEKLRVAHSDGCVYHYGWVRPPRALNRKARAYREAYHGAEAAGDPMAAEIPTYQYGRLWGCRPFRGSHPQVMQARVQGQDWAVHRTAPIGHKHDRVGVQLLTWLENTVLGFRIGERRNYVLLPGEAPAAWPARCRERLRRYADRDGEIAASIS